MAREYRYVKSSNLQGVAYNPDTLELYVQFSNGTEYAYSDVPESDYDGLLNAASVGSYFNDNIKNAYTYRRV